MTTEYIIRGVKLLHKTKCAITGQDQNCFIYGFDEEDYRCIALKIKLLQQISILYNYGIHVFLTDCSLGTSMWSAEIVAGLVSLHPDIELLCIIPYEEQATKWPKEYRNRYFSLHESCTQSLMLSPDYTRDCLLECYHYLVDECDILLAVCDYENPGLSEAGYAVSYAKQINRDIIYIDPVTLTVTPTIFVA